MAWNGFSPLHAVFDERRSDMNSAFEDMNMEVCMEENPFEDGGLPEGDSGKEDSRFSDGFTDSGDLVGEVPFDTDRQEPEPAAVSLPAQEEADPDAACKDGEEESGPESNETEDTEDV